MNDETLERVADKLSELAAEGEAHKARLEATIAEAKAEQKKSADKYRLWNRVGSVLGGAAAIAAATSLGALQFANWHPERTEHPVSVVSLELRLAQQQQQIDQLRQQVQAAIAQTQAQTPTGRVPPNLVALEKRIAAVEAQENRMSAVVLATPEKALTLPMMRRDIDDLKANSALAADQLRRDIDRVYDLNKWIIGGLGAGVLSLAVSQFIRRKAEQE